MNQVPILLADSPEGITAIFVFFFIFGLPALTFLGIRYLAHRERMEAIRYGLPLNDAPRFTSRPAQSVPPPDFNYGKSSGCADPLGYDVPSAQRALRKGILMTAIGAAVTIGLSFIGLDGNSFRLGPWLIGGLVPLFIGMAQIVIAISSGATIRPVQYGGPYQVPPPYEQPGRQQPGAPPQPPPVGGPFDGSYTYRPGGTQELQRPVPPPKRP